MYASETFAGTHQFMEPAATNKAQGGCGAPTDIWSLGCTIVEMATCKPPFIELGSPEAAMLKYKIRKFTWNCVLTQFQQVGHYKMHPEIQSEMSDWARSSMMRCFEPDSDRRATSAELMDDNLLSE